MILELSPDDLAAIRRHGEQTYPHECCGILLGELGDNRREVHRLLPIDNDREDAARHNRYTIPPRAYLQAERTARDAGLEIVGFYHSHPDVAAEPSAYDLEHAWPVYAYVIVSVRQGQAQESTCWRMRDDRTQFDAVDLVERSEA